MGAKSSGMKTKKKITKAERKEIELVNEKNIELIDKLGLSEFDYLFCEEYLDCMNGTQAWITLNPETTYPSARAAASAKLTNPNVKAYLKKRMSEQLMGKEEILKRLKDQAEATLFPFVKIDNDGLTYFNFKDPEAKAHFYLIKKIRHRKKETFNEKNGEATEENWVEVELHDAQKALELLGKYHALWVDKTEHTERRVIEVTLKKEE